ncbi:MAG: lysylphosphatidylglycerol synthase transmembrane domain-containing protein, partial [Candidatus Zixiibacteriota bacterium]
MDLIIDKKHVTKGFRLFVLLSLLGFALVFFFTTTSDSLKALFSFKKNYIILALFLVLVDFFLGGLRIHVFFTKEVLKKVSLLDCIKANLANIFVAAVTPSNTGGGPAQLYILTRRGAPFSGAMSVSLINFFSSLLFFLASFLLVFFFTKEGVFSSGITYLVKYSFLVFSLFSGLATFIVLKPESLNFLFGILTKITKRIWKKNREKGERIAQKLKDQVVQFRFYLRLFIYKEKLILFVSFVLTIMIYLNKYLIAYVIVKGLGLDVKLVQVIYLQVIQFFLLYFSPTPGASGIAEVSSVSLMSTIMPVSYLPAFAILWRFFV